MRELICKFEAEIQRLRWLTALNNLETAVRRYALALKYRPDQLRVPAGNPDGGQWTHEGGDDNDPLQDVRPALAQFRLPRVPNSRPSTAQERNRIARELGREGGREALSTAIAAGATWLYEQAASFHANLDLPKSLDELQKAASDPRPGYDIHHIVERATAAEDGSEDRVIDAPENLVRIPRWKHWALNRWYEMPNRNYGGMTPREYLRGTSWVERRRVGLQGLTAVGVLEP